MGRYFDECNEALIYADSRDRGIVLASINACKLTDVELRDLLANWWVSCEAVPRECLEVIYAMFERVALVSDCQPHIVPAFPCEVYRAYVEGTDPLAGLSWTTSIEVAHFFAGYLQSPRAEFLGIHASGRDVRIAKGQCTRAVGYFDSREEFEVIPARGAITLLGYVHCEVDGWRQSGVVD